MSRDDRKRAAISGLIQLCDSTLLDKILRETLAHVNKKKEGGDLLGRTLKPKHKLNVSGELFLSLRSFCKEFSVPEYEYQMFCRLKLKDPDLLDEKLRAILKKGKLS